MKIKLVFVAMLAISAFTVNAQDRQEVVVANPVGEIYSADKVYQTSDGVRLEGNVRSRKATARELGAGNANERAASGCGLFGNWICGRPTVVTDPNYPITWIKCEGTTGKCAKMASAL